MAQVETMKVKAPFAGEYMLINKDEFDPSIHEAFDDPKAKKPKAEASKDEA